MIGPEINCNNDNINNKKNNKKIKEKQTEKKKEDEKNKINYLHFYFVGVRGTGEKVARSSLTGLPPPSLVNTSAT